MSRRQLLREFINEVLAGFGNKSYGRDGVAGNLHPDGVSTGASQVKGSHGNVLDDEAAEEQQGEQSTKQAACCLIISDDGRILAVSRRNDPTMWGLPGGKVDPGEEPIEAAARELREETGLVATRLSPVYSRGDGQGFVTHTFACEVSGQIETNEEGVIRWVHPSVLVDPASSPFVDYNTKLFKRLNIEA